jgi:hypothetical protein
MITDPTHYGLPARVQLEALGDNRLGIRKVIKSRIIRKDRRDCSADKKRKSHSGTYASL